MKYIDFIRLILNGKVEGYRREGRRFTTRLTGATQQRYRDVHTDRNAWEIGQGTYRKKMNVCTCSVYVNSN